MNYSDLIKSFERKKLELTYHFTGEEEFLKNEAISKLIKALVPDKLKDFNLNLLYASQMEASEIINSCSTFPLNNPKRVVILYELEKLSPKNKEALLHFLPAVPKTTCLVLVSGKVKTDSKFYKELNQIATTVQFGPLYDNQIPDWIITRVKNYKIKIDQNALELLQNSVGNSLPDLANEIEKLYSFLGKRERITLEDVRIVVGQTKTTNVFELANCVGQKDNRKSLFVLEKLLLAGERPTSIIYWLTQHFIRLVKTKGFSEKKSGMPLSTYLGIRPFFVRDYKSQAQNFTWEELEQALLFLHQADLEIKSNRLPNKLAMELLIYNLCSLK
ncbi:MAG: DNA polymerase III subunit delta [candidate division Zixibacteria bacterium]|nr:DNA polymerase III subunit delta [candidate division Zixibacteria bacterium]